MNVNHLRFFLATLDEGSLTAAARRCFVTQPTLSTGLASLEKEVGGKLLERSRSGVSLTPLGESILETAREIVNRVSALRNAARKKNENYLRLAITSTVDADCLKRVINHYIAKESGEVRIIETHADDAEELLASGRVDVLLTTTLKSVSDTPGVVLASDTQGLMIPTSHALSSQKNITAKLMDGENIIVRMHGEETWMGTQVLRAANSNPFVVARVKSDQYAGVLVAAGLGVCVITEQAFKRLDKSDSIVWLPIEKGDIKRRVQLVWRDDLWRPVFSDLEECTENYTEHQILS